MFTNLESNESVMTFIFTSRMEVSSISSITFSTKLSSSIFTSASRNKRMFPSAFFAPKFNAWTFPFRFLLIKCFITEAYLFKISKVSWFGSSAITIISPFSDSWLASLLISCSSK